ncbi:NADH-ubiquinone oxidoreductase chain N [Thermogutta terrifontis]|uniref:NADH-quinone oxidoreductase subunit N n=1 Tax=Thermogutta terrifontis TaxID=1331910 RepID=A0A286RE94_9BACT|nr:NADH-quinone oxidoreductase subunit N [Thermogutta terrifontis]ASV74288.1 NADH-ubiquinone oxidoreductase chain N [Thermogutta terrifontis]
MNELLEIITQIEQNLAVSLRLWLPEICLGLTAIALLLQRMVFPAWRRGASFIMFVGSVAAFAILIWQAASPSVHASTVGAFLDLLRLDQLAAFFRGLILLFAVLFSVLTWLTRWPRVEDRGEFYVLFLGSVIGMSTMVAAENLLLVFLGMEMASLPSYILAGFEKRERRAGEAAMKFAVFGAAMAGVMLYGLGLLGGALGSLDLPTMGANLIAMASSRDFHGHGLSLILGTLMVLAGIGFKLSAVPFHFWLPDVFEGAAAEVGAFLSVISKAAALGLLTRLCLTLLGADQAAAAGLPGPLVPFVVGTLSLLAAVTCTYGNLAAYGQTNFKRLLGYSTIAHAGYLMMPVAAAVAVLPLSREMARWAVASMLFYLVVYMFMNIVAFAGAAFLSRGAPGEKIENYSGLVRAAPGFVVCLTLTLFSLVGLPPLGGFAGKFAIFASLASAQLWALLVVAALNTVFSLFYYVRVVKVMVLDPASESLSFSLPLSSPQGMFLVLATVPVVLLGILWQPAFELVCWAAGCQ